MSQSPISTQSPVPSPGVHDPCGTGDVEIFRWNPVQPLSGRRGRRRGPVLINNFGDLLGPLVVQLVHARNGRSRHARRPSRLLSVGSVLHFAGDGDTVWGTGRNGKVLLDEHRFQHLDVRAVRGPHTRQFLLDRGVAAPSVFGDPALLLPSLLPELEEWAADKPHRVTVVPNFNEHAKAVLPHRHVLDPRSPVLACLKRIAQSQLVVGSSLHGLVVAESLGIPARRIRSSVENDLKYRDYYAGTGRPDHTPAINVRQAVRMGGEPPLGWDPEPLMKAFPADLWLERGGSD